MRREVASAVKGGKLAGAGEALDRAIYHHGKTFGLTG